MFSLSSYNQSIDVMITNFNLSKVTNVWQANAIEQELRQKGIRTDGSHLCTHNFWDVKRGLQEYQQYFRQLFGHLSDDELRVIESEEKALIPQTWYLWHHYAHNPKRTYRRPVENVQKQVGNELRTINRWINRTLDSFNNPNRKAEQANITQTWQNQPALILQLDVAELTTVLSDFEELMRMMNQQFRSLPFEDLKHYLLQERYPEVVVIPTTKGRAYSNNVWIMYALSTILNKQPIEEHKPAVYQMQPAPIEWLLTLGINTWDHPQITRADEISGSVSALMLMTSQVAGLATLDQVNDEADDVVQDYLEEQGKALSELIQQFIDHTAAVQDEATILSVDQRTNRARLVEARDLSDELIEYVVPAESETGTRQLDLITLGEYSKRLEEVFLVAEYVRMLLIADVVEALQVEDDRSTH